MLNSKAIVCGFCLFFVIGLAAQDCHLALRGYVREEGSEIPLAYATVMVREVARGATTDENGHFAISDLCENTAYTVEVKHLECEHFTQIVSLTENTELCFHLQHHVLAEVVVHEKALAARITNAQNTVDQADLEAARGLNLGETLKKLPGVSILNTGATIAKPIIQGLHSNRIAIVGNGVALEGQQWGSEHAPEIDPFASERVSVVKGAAGVQYGAGAIGGAIILEPAPLRETEGWGGWLNLGGFSNGRSGVAAGALDWHLPGRSLVLRLQGTAKRSGNLRAPDYFLGNTGAAELNFSVLTGWSKGAWQHEIAASRFDQQLGILRAAHIGNLTHLQAAIDSPVPLNNPDFFTYDINRPYQSAQHNTLKYKTIWRFSDVWKLTGQYSFQYNHRREYDVVRKTGAAASKPQVSFRLWTNTADLALEHLPRRHWQGGIGVQAIKQTNFVSRGGFIPDYSAWSGGVWAKERWRRFPSPWEFEIGLRYDYRQTSATTDGNLVDLDTLVRFGNVSGTMGWLYHVNQNLTFSLNTGHAWRPPHVNEQFARGVHHGAGTYEEGNPNILSEKAWNTNLSVQWSQNDWSTNLTLYRNQIRDFIYLNPSFDSVLTSRGAFPAYYYEQANVAVLQGIDWQWAVPLRAGLNVEGAWSMLRGFRRGTENGREWLPLLPADRFQYGIRWQRAKSHANHASERKNSSFGNTYMRLSATTALRQTRIPTEGLRKAVPAGFTTLHFDAAHSFKLSNKKRLDVGLTAQNISQTRYREYLNFFRYYADEPGFNLGFRIKLTFL